ncbi:uncharacterized protein LOC134724649 [Mytilus trossulus]|uniref:uncharacterized protein LOC134724649 n=1 Tax=Mytilus trossulus TaxID=6551 RepID=UPI003005E6EF
MFRFLLVVSTIFGFVLCFLSLVLPYWVIFETATYSGQIGVFFICINQHEGGVSCSRIVKDSYTVDHGSYKIPQVFMCIGFSFYLISVLLATMTFFWTHNLKKIRGIKFAAASFSFLTAICLVVTVVVFHKIHDKETETISYGWYISVISLGCVTLACPCYIIDGCHTIDQKDEKVPKTNTAPSPTAFTVYQRQILIDGFNNQMSEQESQLPEPFCIEDKYAIFSDETDIDHHPPKPLTTNDSDNDTNELKSTTSSEFSIKTIDDCGCNEDNFVHPPPKMVSSDPLSSDFSYKTIDDYDCNDDNFVHPPPKIVSADTPLKDILLKNLQPHSGNDRDIEIQSELSHALPKEEVVELQSEPSNALPTEETVVLQSESSNALPTEEAVVLQSESSNALPTEEAVVLQSESSNALPIEEAVVLQAESSNALPIEEMVIKQSEAVNDNDTQYTDKSAPKRSSRRYKSGHNNQASAKSNNTIFRAQYGTSSPYANKPDLPREKGENDDKRQKPEKKSSKRTKQNSTQHGKTKRKLGDSRVAHKDSNAAKEEIPNEATVKGLFGYSNGNGILTQFLKENETSSDLVADTFDENYSGKRKHKNENKLCEQSEKEADSSVSCKDLDTIKEETPIEAKTKSVVGKREFLYI